ncbi:MULTISPECIES: cation-translocating P-type ATPase [unclassified Mesorhizobium]|uniref:cation-translocating P-type ATPase n=1 Tax=unclassified Mesorhizobium TaxID=325217 RepID=UPI00112DCB37|nr:MULTISPECIES: cation-translocating P-type ATPase [unclassified Mesorhizobium]MBZ9700812.1 cation-translocating P-type ATPase [Mesorhizobium sp. CO1-1-3]MBZ9946748.1 cation-translocating P-type ATPase [Mesorhizobium sp. BR1-1-11]TPJ04712.1 cation-translocating P-type ATPase [Mesorhizobium sp. B2-8-1]
MSRATSSTIALTGLSEAEAQARLVTDGFNELPRSSRRTPLRIAIEVVREPMLALLLGGGCVYLLLGDLQEALILIAFATLSVGITIVQEARTERVLEALRDLTSPRALVIRDGERRRIAGREVVRGDTVVLGEGDRIPADILLIQSRDIQTDESLLTGESVPVRKIAAGQGDLPAECRPGGDDLPFAFSGSLVVRGSGIGEVLATGPLSQIGAIGQSLSTMETEAPRLQRQTKRLVAIFALVGGAVSVLAVVLYGLLRGGWLDAALAGIALGMSMLPEEFPMVLTIFMAMGAWRISQARVLTRRAAAIETLGSATVLCTDKTGTLTENRMTIAELRTPDGKLFRLNNSNTEMPAAFGELVEIGVLASAEIPFDPMERAFHKLAQERFPKRAASTDRKLARAYGLRPELLAMSNAWQSSDGGADCLIAAKGSPEAIAALCHLPADRVDSVKDVVDAMAMEGLRVLGVAVSSHAGDQLPDKQTGFDFEFIGLVGLADPLRSGVPDAVSNCRSAGIRVIMITGDYPATAKAIASQAGLDFNDVVTGEELKTLDDAALSARVRTAAVFARIMPEQKLAIVRALKANGEIVAMTGDGVNDAPSLKAANIGIAMGGRGTDVAREASSIVLLDDDFGSIVKAIRLGRRIYDNLRKAMGFILAVHVPIAGLALLPLLFGLPILFGPIHIAFLEMVIDPVCSLVFEAETEEDDTMRRPPRNPEAALFSRSLIAWSVVQGLLAFALVAGIFLFALHWGMPENEIRALTFFSLVLTIVGLIFVNRTFSELLLIALFRPNRSLAFVVVVVAAALGGTLLWPLASDLFQFGPLHLDDLAVTLAAGLAVLVCLEFLKHFWRERLKT